MKPGDFIEWALVLFAVFLMLVIVLAITVSAIKSLADAAPPLPIEATTLDLLPDADDDTNYDTFDWVPVELPVPVIDTQTFEQDADGVWHTNKPTITFEWEESHGGTTFAYGVYRRRGGGDTEAIGVTENARFKDGTILFQERFVLQVVPLWNTGTYQECTPSVSDFSDTYIWDTLDAWIVQDGGTMILRWDHTQLPATVQQSSDLISWTDVATVPGTECQYVIDMPMQAAKRFYRVRIDQ